MKKNSFPSVCPNESSTQTDDFLTQGFSGSQVTRDGELLIKCTSDEGFSKSKERQIALIALTKQLRSCLKTQKGFNRRSIKRIMAI